ncbi:oligoendopeptidase F [Schinkia azotoformans MEV2011]|uniref:Oligopeptidase F n=1 Tax=Schinkia azotoformans MEV2011 TaxID=1348973 RepID=A0A072NM73_SCHAZ|nr:oligoendopeptidase F [Schinkia azotoformans]KEF38541.1 oligoendopeptidase F [Schinkia azotoformans MEV2011]MEC1695149.1 oligoendopeptidase F [Schinkia azotoformans]MEC1717606.1 oligoendopeptidase F [Schinkia azotoformans]MEC1723792.1 oligoendopeptidase F [Schinkia azotoformans]MEC1742343.1 oligoendopeptidase F [Schinkia azotoformans]
MKTYTSRSEIPVHEKWNLDDIYIDDSRWEEDFDQIEQMVEELKKYNGSIQNGKDLCAYLKRREELSYKFKHVYSYCMLKVDEDTRDTSSQAMLDRAKALSVKISAATSFFMPYLLSLQEETLKAYIAEEEGLKYFEEDLFDAFRYKPHVLSKEQEEILSQLGEALSVPSNTFGMINNADIKFGEVTGEDGEKVQLTRGMYSKLIEDEDREKRREAYKAYYQPYVANKNTIASTLSGAIKNNVTLARIRNYPSALEKALFGDNVPKEVYENLITSTKENIASMHEYSKIRKEKLGVDELHQYDLSVPLVQGVKQVIPYEEAFETMLKGLASLGEDYLKILKEFKSSRYIDVRETPGKRSGAYNLGIYGVHPYILLNHQDNLDSLFTLAHECGHGVHSKLSSQYQPQITAGYSIFVAEVASTVNEVLLINYLLNNEKDQKVRNYLLNHFINQFKGTFFTQVMFAEFEMKTHEMAEKGIPLNVEVFNQTYEALFREYNGPDIVFDEEVKYGWSRIPHFYRPFYVYKYATGFASAIHIATKILEGDQETLSAYIEFLKSGSSDYPLELLKKTGVDLTTPTPIENALKRFSELIKEFSEI